MIFMIFQCPTCEARFRFKESEFTSRLVTLNCPRCTTKLQLKIKRPAILKALVAHEDQAICQQLLALLKQLPFSLRICRKPQDVTRHLTGKVSCLLLIDVAFAGGFPFDLIDQVKQQRDGVERRIVLLSSVYNKTAYKKKPTSLYGADRYLELHHIGDCLLPVIAELFPQLSGQIADPGEQLAPAGERNLTQGDLRDRAMALSRVLIADIALYHQDRLRPGLQIREAEQILADCLSEGRQLLLQRLPEAATLSEDCLQLVFDEFYQAYSCHQQGS